MGSYGVHPGPASLRDGGPQRRFGTGNRGDHHGLGTVSSVGIQEWITLAVPAVVVAAGDVVTVVRCGGGGDVVTVVRSGGGRDRGGGSGGGDGGWNATILVPTWLGPARRNY
jgi:hypothetical protein